MKDLFNILENVSFGFAIFEFEYDNSRTPIRINLKGINKSFASFFSINESNISNYLFDKHLPYLSKLLFEHVQNCDDINSLKFCFKFNMMEYEVQLSFIDFNNYSMVLNPINSIDNQNQSKNKFFQLFENSYDIIYRTDLNGNVIEINSVVERYGYSVSELLGNSILQVYKNPNEREKLVNKIMQEGSINDFELELLTKDNQIRTALVSSYLIKDETNNQISIEGVVRDITERKELEKKLLQSKELLNDALNSIRLPISVFNANDYTVEFTNIAFVNKRMIGSKCYENNMNRCSRCEGDYRNCAIDIVKQSGKEYIFEDVFIDDYGNELFIEKYTFPIFDSENNVSKIIQYCTDVTHQKVAIKTIQNQYYKLEALNSIASIIVKNDDKQVILSEISKIMGQILECDRIIFYEVSMKQKMVIGLTEWLNPADENIEPTISNYPLKMFKSSFEYLYDNKSFIESYSNNYHQSIVEDNSYDLLHIQMNIKSLIWKPFSFDIDRFYLLAINQVSSVRQWTNDEQLFIDSVLHKVNYAFQRLELLKSNLEKSIQLAESERFKSKIIESLPDLLFRMDKEGRYIELINIPEDLMIEKMENVIGRLVSDVIPGELGKRLVEAIQQAHKTNEITIVEYSLQLPVGHKHFEARLIPFSSEEVLAFIRDITEQKVIEIEIKEKSKLLQSITDNMFDFITITDLDGNIKFVGKSHKKFGYDIDKMIGLHTSAFIYPDDLENMNLSYENFLANPQNNRIVLRWLCADGSYLWLESVATIIYDENGEPYEFLFNSRDISDRLASDELLRKSEEMYRLIVEHSTDLVWSMNSNGEFTYISPSWEKVTGFTPEMLVGKHFKDYIHQNYLLDAFDYFTKTLTSGKPADSFFEYELMHADNNYYFHESTISPLLDRNNTPIGVVGICRNITDRKKWEIAIIQSEEKYRALVDNSFEGIMIASLEGNILFLNKALLKMLEFDNENEAIGKNVFEFISAEYHPKAYEDFVNVANGVDSYIAEYFGFTSKGNGIWFESIGKLINYNDETADLISVRDITLKKKTEQELIAAKERAELSERNIQITANELREKNLFIQKVLDNLPIGVSLNTIDHGTAKYLNKKFIEIYGWEEDEIKNISDFFQKVYPDDEYRKLITSQVLADIRSGDPKRMRWSNIEITRKDSTKRIVNAVNIPLAEQNTMVSTVIDITELYKTQQDLIKAKESAEESEKVKSAFLANMSHEIRTPMNGILGFIRLLQEEDLSQLERQEFSTLLEKSGKRLLNTINDILEVSKLESGSVGISAREFNFNSVIRFLYNIYSLEAKNKGIEFKLNLQIPDEIAVLYNDKSKFETVISNVINNAVKFTKKGFVEIGNYIIDNKFVIFVKDTGIGIPKDKIDVIFERFAQADISISRPYEGVGLGLSIAKSYLDMLNGNITVDSEVGNGSTFYVEFDYPKTTTIQCSREENIIEKTLSNKIYKDKITILIAEDDDFSFEYYSQILRKRNFELIRTTDGTATVETVKNNPNISFVLMDFKMPKMNGIDATKEIRKFNKDIKIIAQTAFAMESDKIEAINAGCNKYLSKPVSQEDLLDVINSLL